MHVLIESQLADGCHRMQRESVDLKLRSGRGCLPSRRACLSFLPCKISSSSFLVRSASSRSRWSPSSLMRFRKSLTSSDPSSSTLEPIAPANAVNVGKQASRSRMFTGGSNYQHWRFPEGGAANGNKTDQSSRSKEEEWPID